MKQNGSERSRREFAGVFVAGSAALSAFGQAPPLTAGQVVERIRQNLGIPWRGGEIDTFKSGAPETPVTGIVTTMMSTFDVLKRSVAARKNMIITHEPTFWSGSDAVAAFAADPLYLKKSAYIKDNGLVIWRFHDHLHARRPDMTTVGLAQSLGWEKYESKENPQFFDLPAVTLKDLARDIEKRLKVRCIRVIGDASAKMSRAGFLVGAPPAGSAYRIMQQVDVVIAGEQREWEGIEYAWDLQFAGEKKGMILLGHCVSEEQGMRVCADWLKTFIKETPIEFISAGEPFWR
jgi:putative NIF3 family GTP cyclohydrolase 1 type 2